MPIEDREVGWVAEAECRVEGGVDGVVGEVDEDPFLLLFLGSGFELFPRRPRKRSSTPVKNTRLFSGGLKCFSTKRDDRRGINMF